MKISIQFAESNKAAICEKILRALPNWFGIESSILDYIKDVKSRVMLTATIDSEVVGFISLTEHSPQTAEVHLIGVLEKYHRHNIGAGLVEAAEKYLAKKDFHFLSVKTLSASREDANYARTRKFYLAMGFVPVEEFKTLWGEHNPCLFMIKALARTKNESHAMFEPIFLDTKNVKIRPLATVSWEMLAKGLLYEGSFHGRNWGIKTPEDIRKMYERVLKAPSQGIGNGVVFLNQAETEVLGMTQFMNVEPQHAMIEIGGTWISQKWQRSYVNTETKLALLQYVFETLRLNRVEFRIDSDNKPSRNAVTRLGFHFDGVLPRRKINANKETRDYAFYSVTDLTWPTVKQHIQFLLTKYDSADAASVAQINEFLKLGKHEEAFAYSQKSIHENPKSAGLHYLAACICDGYRTEAEAVPFYLKAIELGLGGADLQGAYLGLASTLRSLGRYLESKETFEMGIKSFPNYRPYFVFLALTENNLGNTNVGIQLLLEQLVETTSDVEIKSYERALKFYSTRLNEVFP